MKKFLLASAFILAAGLGAARADTATDGWQAGVGFSYPRFYLVNITALNSDLGAYASLQRNFSEHTGLRLKGAISHMEGQWTDSSLNLITEDTNLITLDLDLLYYLAPCEPVTPFLFAGVGANYKLITNGQTAVSDKDKFGTQVNLGGGVEFKLVPDWNLAAEIAYHVTDNSVLDGTVIPDGNDPPELNGHDSYLSLNLGVNFVFSKGEPSAQCEGCGTDTGMTQRQKERLAYNSAVVDRYILSIANDKLALVGVNFAFDEAKLTPESYAVLDKTVKLMTDRPAMKVEIQGYTDFVGSNDYNIELSAARADAVKDYLVSKGIDESRLTTVNFGQTGSRSNNMTAEGRELNRRVILKIVK